MEWFGEDWGAPVNYECDEAPVPAGEKCYHCEKVIEPGDQGFVLPHWSDTDVGYSCIHRDCMTETILGPNWREILEPDM